MIVLDIETSGIDFNKCGIWQIGAIDLESMGEFLEECRLGDEDEIINEPSLNKTVLEVTGKTEEELRDKNKQTQKEMLEKFFRWVGDKKIKNCLCQNPQFDMGFIWTKARKYGLKVSFHYRSFDLHSIAQTDYYKLKKEFLIDKDHSGMSLTKILKFCGMEDNRKDHNALEDAKLTAECFSRLIYGRNLFAEFSEFEVPKFLKQGGKNE